jgi:hypothetical protein
VESGRPRRGKHNREECVVPTLSARVVPLIYPIGKIGSQLINARSCTIILLVWEVERELRQRIRRDGTLKRVLVFKVCATAGIMDEGRKRIIGRDA